MQLSMAGGNGADGVSLLAHVHEGWGWGNRADDVYAEVRGYRKAGSGRADAVAWEGEGKMLAYSQGGKTMVVEAKKWEDVVVTCGGHGKDVRDIAWGEVMVTVGMDRKVIVFGK